jgi:hypothetical protein
MLVTGVKGATDRALVVVKTWCWSGSPVSPGAMPSVDGDRFTVTIKPPAPSE